MISIIIPTLNEKKNLKKIAKKLANLEIVNEVIFVDDNSKDGTFKEIQKISNMNSKFLGILSKKKRKNLSASVLEGALIAKNKLIVVMDADLQHNINYILKMHEIFKKNYCDIVIASRFLNNNFFGNFGFYRSILSSFCIFFIHLLFKKKTSDPLSGFFICKKKIIIDEYKNFYLQGFKILFDILYNGKKRLKCQDLPIIFEKRKYETSKFNYKIMIVFVKQLFFTFLNKKKSCCQ